MQNVNRYAHSHSSQSESVGLLDNFQAKAAKFKALTDSEIVVEKNENGEFIHMLHPESTQRLGFFGEFFRVGFNDPSGFEATLENLARKYAELREALMAQYIVNQDELYKQLGELNQAFENALLNTTMTRPEQSHYLDTFFEIFILSIQNTDFDTAFAVSIESLTLFNLDLPLQAFTANPNVTDTNTVVNERIFNIRGGQLIIFTYADGTQRAEIVRGGVYGKTNAELGHVNDYDISPLNSSKLPSGSLK